MRKSVFTLFLFLFSFSIIGIAQTKTSAIEADGTPEIYGGIGLGIDYGGIFGLRAEYQPLKYVGVLGGLGYNLNGFGFNFGVAGYPLPDWKVQPYLMALYGYNAVVVISGMPEYNKTYYGFSAGIGFALKTSEKGNKLVFELFKPFRNQSFKDDYENLKNNPSVSLGSVYPLTFSIGFNWAL